MFALFRVLMASRWFKSASVGSGCQIKSSMDSDHFLLFDVMGCFMLTLAPLVS